MTPYTDEQKADLAKRIEARADAVDFNSATTLAQASAQATEVIILHRLAAEMRDGSFFEARHD